MIKFVVLFLIILNQYLLAIVSKAPVEIGDKAGLHANVALSFETKRGNTHKDNYKASIKVSYDDNSSFVTWSELSGEYGEVNEVQDTNKLYLHLRHIHAITKEDIRSELFGQIEEDRFKLIKNRSLAGMGVRFKIFEIFKDARGYLGLGGFYEKVNYTTLDAQETNIRLNSYFAYTTVFGDDSELTYSLYYQPKFDDFKDYAQSHKLQLQVHIYQALFLSFQVEYAFDSQPVAGVEDYDVTQTTSFIYKF